MKQAILDRLRGSRAAADPVAAALAGLPAEIVAAVFPGPLTPAAVLVPLVVRQAGVSLVMTRRAEHLRDHPGQISFPGGRVSPGDPSPVATALRELDEEIGVAAGDVELAGFLPPHPVITGFVVTPVVGFLATPTSFRCDPVEVAEVFEAPLDFFLDPANCQRGQREVRGVTLGVLAWEFGGHRIWGATANIIQSLCLLLQDKTDE